MGFLIVKRVFVNFLIVKHEAQCVALFRLLEQECLAVRKEGVPKCPANSGKKGLRANRLLL